MVRYLTGLAFPDTSSGVPMRPPPTEPGYGRFSKLAWLALGAALVYAGVTYWPVAKTYFTIKQDARRLVIRTLNPGEDPEIQIQRFIELVRQRDKIPLTRSHIAYQRQEDRAEISVRLALPVAPPGVSKRYSWTTVVKAEASRERGF